jgi:hypothetical protein
MKNSEKDTKLKFDSVFEIVRGSARRLGVEVAVEGAEPDGA